MQNSQATVSVTNRVMPTENQIGLLTPPVARSSLTVKRFECHNPPERIRAVHIKTFTVFGRKDPI